MLARAQRHGPHGLGLGGPATPRPEREEGPGGKRGDREVAPSGCCIAPPMFSAAGMPWGQHRTGIRAVSIITVSFTSRFCCQTFSGITPRCEAQYCSPLGTPTRVAGSCQRANSRPGPGTAVT